jgi:hypothetical protein
VQNIDQHTAALAQLFDKLATTLKENGLSNRVRAKVLKTATLVDKAKSILDSLKEDETEKKPKADRPAKKPAKAKAQRASTAAVKRSR